MSVGAEGTGRKNRETLALNPRSPLLVKQKEDNFLKCMEFGGMYVEFFFFFLEYMFSFIYYLITLFTTYDYLYLYKYRTDRHTDLTIS